MLNEAPYVVVVGTDYSLNCHLTLEEAIRVTIARGGELHVLHVAPNGSLDPLVLPDVKGATPRDVPLEQVRRWHAAGSLS